MSLTYWILFSKAEGYGETADRFIRELNFSLGNDGPSTRDSVAFHSQPFSCRLTAIEKETASWCKEDFAIEVDSLLLTYVAWEDADSDGEMGLLLTKMLCLILSQTDGDVALLNQGETLYFRRDGTGSYIDAKAYFWSDRNRQVLSETTPIAEL